MRRIRTYSAFVLLLLFCCYYSGISMHHHTHITNGSSIVHSHLGGDAQHEHSESQYAVIDILSQFHSEYAETVHFDAAPLQQFTEPRTDIYQSGAICPCSTWASLWCITNIIYHS